MASYRRGNTITWTTTPLGPDGSVAAPASVTLSITYPESKRPGGATRTRTVETVMTSGVGGAWTASWSSVPAIPGTVSWRTQASAPDSADSGSFSLAA